MTKPTDAPGLPEKFPRRVWFGESCDEWGLSDPDDGHSMGYISLSEHEALLANARAEALREAWNMYAYLSECDFNSWLGEFRESKAKAERDKAKEGL